MSAHNIMSEQVLNQAGAWLLELQSPEVTVERIALWQQWLASSPEHARAFDQLQRTWSLADGLARVDRESLPWASADELEPMKPGAPAHRRWVRALALAATIGAIAIGGALWLGRNAGTLLVQTSVGQHRDVQLADGSLVNVGANSRLRVVMEADRRLVELERGEAYFQVAKDRSRPFSVRAGGTAVTAVGTAFNVRRTGARVVVGVSEGAISVTTQEPRLLSRIVASVGLGKTAEDAMRVTAGHGFVVEPNALQVPSIDVVAPPAVGSWRDGHLHYAGEPLSVVIEDVSRYLDRPIAIVDPNVASLRVTGTVSEENVESWLISLPAALPLDVMRREDGGFEVRGKY